MKALRVTPKIVINTNESLFSVLKKNALTIENILYNHKAFAAKYIRAFSIDFLSFNLSRFLTIYMNFSGAP